MLRSSKFEVGEVEVEVSLAKSGLASKSKI